MVNQIVRAKTGRKIINGQVDKEHVDIWLIRQKKKWLHEWIDGQRDKLINWRADR